MLRHSISLFPLLVLSLFAVDANAQYGAPPPAPCTPATPCGAGDKRINKLIPQGWRGAEFRSACVAHDACYDTIGMTRQDCDARFLQATLNSCEFSRRPRQCRRVARLMAKGVERFGSKAFTNAQHRALGYDTN